MNVLQIMQKAAQATPHEWYVRVGQSLSTARLHCLSSLGRGAYRDDAHRRSLGIPTVERLRDWWGEPSTSPWLPAQGLPDRGHAGPDEDTVFRSWIRRADEIRDGQLTFFSRPPITFNHPQRWHRDLVLEKNARPRFYGAIPYLDATEVGDSKHTWEPNRWGWVYPLGASYRIAREESYFDALRQMVLDWRIQNPYPMGINYCSALEQAFRAYAARWALEFFREPLTRPRNGEVLDALIQLIWTACRHVEDNLSWYFAPNTHLLGEAFLLFVVGASLPSFRESSRWLRLGRDILAREFTRQFHADGTHRELSTCYHLYVTDFYLHAWWVAQQVGIVDRELEEAARRTAFRLLDLTPSTGQLPPLNDCDGGRLTWFADRTLDARPSLLLAQQCWPGAIDCHSEWSCAGDHYWMRFKTVAPANPDRRPVLQRNARSEDCDSGIATYHSQTGDYVLFRAGPFGYDECPHSHDNPLEVLIALEGEPIVVDAGTGSYTQGLSLRNRFRSALGKNTPLVCGHGPSEPEGAFSWRRVTPAQFAVLDEHDNRWGVAGYHDGFTHRFGFEVRIQRQVHVISEGFIAVLDRWTADREIAVSIPWTLSPNLQPTNNGWRSPEGTLFQVFLDAEVFDDPHVRAGPLETSQGPYSRDYGWHESTHVVTLAAPTSRRGVCLSLFFVGDELVQAVDRHTYSIVGAHQRGHLSCEPDSIRPFRFLPEGATVSR